MGNNKKNKVDHSEVLRLHSTQHTSIEISTAMGITEYLVEAILKSYGLKPRTNGTKLYRLKDKYQDIIAAYQKTPILVVVAREFNTTPALVNKILQKFNVAKREIYKEFNTEEIIEFYEKVHKVKIVADKYGVSNGFILKLLHSNNVRVSKIKYTEDEIVQKYHELKSLVGVSRELKISEGVISKALTKHNIHPLENKRVNLGDVYGKLTVISSSVRITFSGYEVKEYLCKCTCGGTRVAIGSGLLSIKKPITDCGCGLEKEKELHELKRKEKQKEKEIKKQLYLEKMEAAKIRRAELKLTRKPRVMKYYPGVKKERLFILSSTGIGDGKIFTVQCDCGKIKEILLRNFRNTKSCGCLQREKIMEASSTHGHTSRRDPERRKWYDRWKGMVSRCNNPKMHAYHNYGGRGIRVCDRWLEPNGVGSENYYNDIHNILGPQPGPDHSLDRIDNDGMYEITNLRWATLSHQSKNQRRHQKP
jgi:hypothetical protein